MTGESDKVGSAVVLAGGKSSRMGRPKAMLPFGGEPLIVHVVRRLGLLFPDVVVVAAPGQELPELPVTLVRDDVAYQGPVGGIVYGLRACGSAAGYVTSCDVPFLSLPLVSHMASRLPGHDVVVPYWEGRPQPLHAVYRRSVLPLLEGQLERGELRPVFLYDKVRTLKVGEDEIRTVDPDGSSFFNMNTPEDYSAALARWERTAMDAVPDRCEVELLGAARLRARTSRVSVDLPRPATLAQVLSALALELPALVGPVITETRDGLTAGHVCNLNGRDFVRDASRPVEPGDRLLIMSSDAGG
ncbi:MAG: NTP transferase domain-containing protein [Deltaproteobacteria bacterium]|nr:NTP transferase domain-containing protein [Deltaproteobacteria bacterium]